MAVYFAVGTPTEDGRIQDFRLVPPPGGDLQFPVLVWNPTNQEPEWRPISEVVGNLPAYNNYVPLITDNNEWLVDDQGNRIVANYLDF
jgi:hypothetical protein